jgi:hypothetical protein
MRFTGHPNMCRRHGCALFVTTRPAEGDPTPSTYNDERPFKRAVVAPDSRTKL